MTVVIMAGCMRNGTSICSNVLANSGMWVGKHKELDWRGNRDPEGIWENLNFVMLNNRLIESRHGHWVKFQDVWRAAYYNWDEMMQEDDFQSEIIPLAHDLLDRIGKGQDLWGWKDPRNAFTAPFWIKLLKQREEEKIKLIWSFRDPSESIDSMFSLRYARQRNWHGFWNVWHAYNQSLMNYVQSEEFHSLVNMGFLDFTTVNYIDWFERTDETATRILEFAGLEATPEAIDNARSRIKPELYRYKGKHKIYSSLYENMLALRT